MPTKKIAKNKSTRSIGPSSECPTEGTALILRNCNADMTAYNGFKWPESGYVEAPDWSPSAECGKGLHGWLWGEGDSRASDRNDEPNAKWLIVRVVESECVDLKGKVKFPRGWVVFCGTAFDATSYLVQNGGAGRSIIKGTATAGDWGTATAGDWGTATAGVRGTATAGVRGTATAGDWGTATAGVMGTATAGDSGTIQLHYWDDANQRMRRVIGYVGEDGIEANIAYVVEDGKLVRKT